MSRYRYNAIIHVGHGTETALEVALEDWTESESNLEDIRASLRGRSAAFGIMRIRNARLDRDLRALESIRNADAAVSAGELRREVAHYNTRGIHPQDFADLDLDESGFRVLLSWAAGRADGSYDVLFVPTQLLPDHPCLAVNWPEKEPSHFVNLANSPGQGKFCAELVARILAHCRQNLPEKLVPRDVSLTDTLPRTENGAVDPSVLLSSMPACFY